jgi:outer membrane protein
VKGFHSTITMFALGAAVFCGAPLAAQPQAQLDRERIDQLAREAAQRFALEQTPTPTPQMPAIAGLTTGPKIDLTLEEAVRHASENNLGLAVERLNPQTFDLSLASIRSVYSPTLTSTVGKNDRVNLPQNTLTGGTRVENNTLTYNGGATQQFKWGGSTNLVFNNSKLVTNSANANFNPNFTTSFTANYTQPLLRGFKIDQTRQQIRTTEISRENSEIQLDATTISTLASVRNAYWDFVFGTQAVDVARESLTLAQKLVEDNKTRVEVGTMAPIDVIQAESEAATRRQALVQAEATLRTNELTLKRLIVSGTDDPLWRASLNPVDRPTLQPITLDVEGAVRTALEKRTDIKQAQNTLKSNDVTLRYQQNLMLPAVDVTASYGLQGIGGNQFRRENPRATDSPIIETITGNYFDALNLLRRGDYPTWNVTANISYPIGRSAAEANYARAKIQLNQARTQLKALELQVAAEVTNTALTVTSNAQRVEAATAARELSQKKLEAEQSKFEVGMSTNFQVVQAQRDLRDAQNTELRALLDYRKSLVDFERVQITGTGSGGVSTVSSGGTGGTTGARTTGGTAGTGGGGGGGGN